MTSQHFVSQSDEWKCLRNKPKKGGNYTLITEKIEYEYSLDDQVRQRSSKISNTRYTVWDGVRPGILLLPEFPTARPMRASVVRPSGQLTTLLLQCRIFPGLPTAVQDQEGSSYGWDCLWKGEVVGVEILIGTNLSNQLNFRCVNGHCESTSKNIGRSDGLKHNSLDGSWGSWSRYQPNSCGGQIQFVDILGCGKSALDTSGGAAVPAHAGLGSASEVVLATTPDQPMEARLGVGQCACSFRSGVSRQERGVQTLQHQPVHQRYHRHLEK